MKKKKQSLTRRTLAFVEVEVERDKLYHTLGAVKSLIQQALALIEEDLGNMEKHKAEVKKLLNGIPFDEAA